MPQPTEETRQDKISSGSSRETACSRLPPTNHKGVASRLAPPSQSFIYGPPPTRLFQSGGFIHLRRAYGGFRLRPW